MFVNYENYIQLRSRQGTHADHELGVNDVHVRFHKQNRKMKTIGTNCTKLLCDQMATIPHKR